MDNQGEPAGETWTPGKAEPAERRTRAKRGAIWNPVNRRNAREWAMQMLFLLDSNPPEDGLDRAIEDFWQLEAVEDAPPEKNLQTFAESIVRGVWENRDAIDARISSYLDNWTIDRIDGVVRNVLRMAIFELFYRDDTPPVSILNEAVDITKFFSTRNSAGFVNGVLDRAMKDVGRDLREAKKPAWLRKRK